jgi:pantothenate kinase
MSLDKNVLLNFLKALDDEIDRKITLVAVGGTAMTLLDLKPSTVDIDFTISNNSALGVAKSNCLCQFLLTF